MVKPLTAKPLNNPGSNPGVFRPAGGMGEKSLQNPLSRRILE
jgi:hypothetical protein